MNDALEALGSAGGNSDTPGGVAGTPQGRSSQREGRAKHPMPKLGTAAPLQPDAGDRAAEAAPTSTGRVLELRVGGHLMQLEAGLFCVLHAAGSPVADASSGLPGVRISVPPGMSGRTDSIDIRTFHGDGWLSGDGDAALVRVSPGGGQLLVTVYQSANGNEPPPRLQVLQLCAPASRIRQPPDATANVGSPPSLSAVGANARADIVAHVQRNGDIPARIGEWAGTRGSRLWMEGFAISPPEDVDPQDLEYQAVLGRGWLSPWVRGGEYCGSRGMALPILGLRIRLVGEAAEQFSAMYSATFTDGSSAGPAQNGEGCEVDSLAPLEAFVVSFREKGRTGGSTQGVRGSSGVESIDPPGAEAERGAYEHAPARRARDKIAAAPVMARTAKPPGPTKPEK